MATPETTRDSLYIDGAWVPSTGSGTIEVIDSTTEEVMGTVPEGTRRGRRPGRGRGRGRLPGLVGPPGRGAHRAT